MNTQKSSSYISFFYLSNLKKVTTYTLIRNSRVCTWNPIFKFCYLFKVVYSFKDMVLFFLRWSRPLTCFSSCSMISHLWGRPCELWWLSAWLTPRLTNAWPTWMGILNIPILCVEAKNRTKMHYAAFPILSLQQNSKVILFIF